LSYPQKKRPLIIIILKIKNKKFYTTTL